LEENILEISNLEVEEMKDDDPKKEFLRRLRKNRNFQGLFVIEKNGLVTYEELPDWVNIDDVKEITFDIMKIVNISNRALKQGIFKSGFLDHEKGRLLFTRFSNSILVIIAWPETQMGILQGELQRIARLIYGMTEINPRDIYNVECEYCKKDYHEKDILEVTVDTGDNFEWWCRMCCEGYALECPSCSRLLKKELFVEGRCALCGEPFEGHEG